MMTKHVVICFQSTLNRNITHLIKKYGNNLVTSVIKFLKALRWLILDHKHIQYGYF